MARRGPALLALGQLLRSSKYHADDHGSRALGIVIREYATWLETEPKLPQPPVAVPRLEPRDPQPDSRRSGVIAVKAGMTQDWDSWNARIPLTVLWIDACQVVQVKGQEKEGFSALQLGCGAKRDKQLLGTQRGHFAAAGLDNKRKLAEFQVTPDALLPVGTELRASHFTAGQFVDVQGTTIGKGFQGVMKRHGFAGQPASHGNSKAHRKPGSTGGSQDPGRVYPGKKMPGHMGADKRTVQNVVVHKVDPVRNLLYVKGQVPGHKGNFVLVSDAIRKQFDAQPPRPFPTLIGEEATEETIAQPSPNNPFAHA